MTFFAMLFPGQGAQYIGMLSSFLGKDNNIFKYTFDEASHYVGYNLLKLIKEGPKKKINQSKYAQAVILTSSVSIYRLWNNRHGRLPSLMSGHSLGEYSALVCSDAIKFSDAVKIVFLRGTLMQKITKNRPSLMQAITNIDQKIVQKACSMASKKKVVSLASVNSHDQVVISGDQSAVYQASAQCRKLGAQYIFNVNINIPAHSKLMQPIAEKLKNILKIITVATPKIPVVNNVDVKIEENSKKIKNALIRQVYSTVRWKEIIDLMQFKKILTMIEIGPSKILTNLNKNNRKILSLSTDNLKNFLITFQKINKESNEE